MRSEFVAMLLVATAILAGCVGNGDAPAGTDDASADSDDGTPSMDGGDSSASTSDQQNAMARNYAKTPYRQLPDEIEAFAYVNQADEVPGGSGIWLDTQFAFVGARNNGLWIVSILDPENPVVISNVSEIAPNVTLYVRDVDLLVQGDHKFAILAGQGQGMHIVDVTNPFAPEYLSTVMGNGDEVNESQRASVHNVAVPPGQSQYAYNSRSNGAGGTIDVVDLSDPEDPKIVADFGDHGCHDITFLDLPNKKRAYCAGIQETQIFDLSDNYTNPAVVGRISVEDAPWTDSFGSGLQHLAMPNKDGTILVLGDEYAGGGGPGCASPPGGRDAGASSPIGALTFFDISDEANPTVLSWISPPPPTENGGTGSCTAHFGTLIEDRPQLVMAWYTAGVVIVDFSDPANPYFVDQIIPPSANVWDARYYQGYVFTGDIARGLDVLTFL